MSAFSSVIPHLIKSSILDPEIPRSSSFCVPFPSNALVEEKNKGYYDEEVSTDCNSTLRGLLRQVRKIFVKKTFVFMQGNFENKAIYNSR